MKKNICILVPSLYGGGAERVAADLSKALSKDYNVYIVTFVEKSKRYDFEGEYICIGTPIRRGIGKLLTIFERVKQLKFIKHNKKIDICISILDGANLVSILSGGKNIVSYHSNKTVADKNIITKFINMFCIKLSYKVVVVSEYIKEDLVENYGANIEKISVIHNMCDIENIKLLAEIETPYKGNNYILATAGNLRKAKGHWHLIKAFSEAKKQIPDMELHIIGEGELRGELEQLIIKLGLQDSVYLEGFQENPFPYIKNADVFVFSSIFEGFGNVIVEALTCEKAIISTDCPAGPKEILNPSNPQKLIKSGFSEADFGILVSPFSTEYDYADELQLNEQEIAYSNAIKYILSNAEKRKWYENRAMQRAMDFSMEKTREKWIQLIEK